MYSNLNLARYLFGLKSLFCRLTYPQKCQEWITDTRRWRWHWIQTRASWLQSHLWAIKETEHECLRIKENFIWKNCFFWVFFWFFWFDWLIHKVIKYIFSWTFRQNHQQKKFMSCALLLFLAYYRCTVLIGVLFDGLCNATDLHTAVVVCAAMVCCVEDGTLQGSYQLCLLLFLRVQVGNEGILDRFPWSRSHVNRLR